MFLFQNVIFKDNDCILFVGMFEVGTTPWQGIPADRKRGRDIQREKEGRKSVAAL